MKHRYTAGAIAGGLLAGLGITAITIAGERSSGRPSELIDLQRASARKLGLRVPAAGTLPSLAEQACAQGGHLLLSGLAGATYASVSDRHTSPVPGGVLFGLGFYVAAHWLAGPALGVSPPEWTRGRKAILMHTLNHLGFGLATAFGAWIAA